MKNKTMYMHTINGLPGRYTPGEQICFVNHYGKFVGRLVPNLGIIKREQRLSMEWRESKGFVTASDYGYIRVELP